MLINNKKLANKKKNKKLEHVMFGMSLAAACGLSACSDASSAADALAEIREKGVVEVAYANEMPMGYEEDGKLTGISIETMRSFFKDDDVEITGTLVEFAGLIPGLTADRYDVIPTAMFITPERCDVVLFSDPELQISTAFAVARGNPLGIESYADLSNHPDAVYGTSAGGQEIELAKVAGVPESRIKQFPSYADAAAALDAGRVDVMAQPSLNLNVTLEALDSDRVEYVVLTEPPLDSAGNEAKGYVATVFRKSDTVFRDAYNEWLADAKDSGELAQIHKQFGASPDQEVDPDLTAQEICGG